VAQAEPHSGDVSTISQPEPAPDFKANSSPDGPQWLARLNSYRRATGLKAVTQNQAQSAADLKHARYLVKNFKPNSSLGIEMHEEDESNRWFSREGRRAGQTSDVIAPSSGAIDESEAIDTWLSAPFHALPMLDPDLLEAGFGLYCENQVCAAVLNVGRGENWRKRQKLVAVAVDSDTGTETMLTGESRVLEHPIEYPPPGSTISDGQFNGMEWPNPLSACPGYLAPSGLVILISFGTEFDPAIGEASLSTEGRPVESCLVTALSYKNPDLTQTNSAHGNLHLYAAAFLIPREPLRPGKYDVSISKDQQPYKWSFAVEPKQLLITH
jgi:uncharacterized protein YkwD